MLQIETWKRVLIWALVALGLLLAAPNGFYTIVERHNDAAQAIELQGGTPTDEQAADLALWPEFLPSALVNLGLDLRGGAHLLAEVQVEQVYEARMEAMWPEVRNLLRPERATVGTIRLQPSQPGEMRVRISEPAGLDRAMELVQTLAQPINTLSGLGGTDIVVRRAGDQEFIVTLSDDEKIATDERTMQQSLEIVRRRIDEAGDDPASGQ